MAGGAGGGGAGLASSTPFFQVLWPYGFSPTTGGLISPVSNSTYFIYMGRAAYASFYPTVFYRLVNAAATITWAEFGIFKGPIVLNGNATLTRLGFIDATSFVTGPVGTGTVGPRKVTIPLDAKIVPGDDVWFAYGVQATTTTSMYRICVVDDIQSGAFQISSSTRISTLSVPFTSTIAAANIAPILCRMTL